MSSLFQALKNSTFKKKSRSKSSCRHRSKSKSDNYQLKSILLTKDQKLIHNSLSDSLSPSQGKQNDVDRIIGKAFVEQSLNECFMIYLIKWKNKTLKESTWQDCRNFPYAKQKIQWFNENTNLKSLPNFYKQYKEVVPNYQQILESSIKRLLQAKKESKSNIQGKEHKVKTFQRKDDSDFGQNRSLKRKKIKKESQSKHKRRKQQKLQQPQRKNKSSHKSSKKQRKKSLKKDKHKQRSRRSHRHEKQHYEVKKQTQEKSFHKRLDKTLKEYFELGKTNNKGTPDEKIPQLLIQSDKVSVSTVFLENSICEKFDDLSATEKSTNYDPETVQDFIFLSDTYKSQDFKIKLQEKQSQPKFENSQLIEDIEFASIQKDLQQGEITFDQKSFVRSRFIELEDGEFNEDDYSRLTSFCA